MTRKRIAGIALGFLACLPVRAAEVRVLRFATVVDLNPPPCVASVGWFSQTFFHNSTDATQAVQFLGVSNGAQRANPKPLLLPPHQTVTIEGGQSLLDWEPAQETILWVNRLSVPLGVIVANRVTSGVFQPDSAAIPCTGRQFTYSGLPLPVFGALISAGTPQYFLGTDVGAEPGFQITDARLNVGIYNGGAVATSAVIKIYCGFPAIDHPIPDTLLQTRQVFIPSNSVVQQTVLASTRAAGCPTPGQSFWYATVNVDQPSFAYAIGLANGTLPTFPGAVALTYTGN